MPPPPKGRGCLRGCFTQLLGLAILCVVVFGVLQVLLAPWNFRLGGHFHWWPGWSGYGEMHTRLSGGDYTLLVTFDPTIPGYRKAPLHEPRCSAHRAVSGFGSSSRATCRARTAAT